MWKLGSELAPETQEECKRSFLYRMTEENLKARPEVLNWMSGYRLRILTDKEWLECTKFAVTKDGKLDLRHGHCETHHPDYKAHK